MVRLSEMQDNKCFRTQSVKLLCIFSLIGFLLLNIGCLAPPILFPITSGQGVVVDQYGHKVPNVILKAYWQPVRIFYMFAPAYHADFKSSTYGTWEFGIRKCSTGLIIEALPPEGYELISGETSSIEVPVGMQKTNVVLKLRKL